MKDEIRKQMKQQRRALTQAQMQIAADVITQKLLKTEVYAQAKTVCLYLSAYKEVETAALIERCKADGKTVALPVTDADGVITLCKDNGEYKTGSFGIKEPAGTEIISPQDVDLFIIPALAFDKTGNRLGFGKGCYDQLLQDAAGYKIGIGYAFQLVEALPSDVHDVKMDMVVCEE